MSASGLGSTEYSLLKDLGIRSATSLTARLTPTPVSLLEVRADMAGGSGASEFRRTEGRSVCNAEGIPGLDLASLALYKQEPEAQRQSLVLSHRLLPQVSSRALRRQPGLLALLGWSQDRERRQ